MQYAAGSSFNPLTEVEPEWLENLLRPAEDISIHPPEFKKAFVYIDCGANRSSDTVSPWHRGDDIFDINNGFNYHVDSKATAGSWTGETISFMIQLESAILANLLVRFENSNHSAAGAVGEFEGRAFTIPQPQEDQDHIMLELFVDREDCLDGFLAFTVHAPSGHTLRISQIALMPRLQPEKER